MPASCAARHRAGGGWSRAGLRYFSFLLGWWLLTEGDQRDVWLGAIVAGLACLASFMVYPRAATGPLRPAGVLRFARFFLVQSLRGGLDVAMRALRPSMPVRPGLIAIQLGLADESSRVLCAWTVSLLPGTASVLLDGDRLTVHMLCARDEAARELEELTEVMRGLRQA